MHYNSFYAHKMCSLGERVEHTAVKMARERSPELWRLAAQFFPDEAAAAAAAAPSSPPRSVDKWMSRLEREMKSLDTCCGEPRARSLARSWTSPPSHAVARSHEHCQASPLEKDLVEEAEQVLQRSILRQRKDVQRREARLCELEAQRDLTLQENRELREQLQQRDLLAKARTEEAEELKDLLRRQSAQLKSLESDVVLSSTKVDTLRQDQQHEVQTRDQEIFALKDLSRALSAKYDACSRELAAALQRNEQLQHAVSERDEEARELVHQLNVLRARCTAVELGVESKVMMLKQHYEDKVAAREDKMLQTLAHYEDAFKTIRAQAPRVYTSSLLDTSYPTSRDNAYIEAMISSLSLQPLESGLGWRHGGEGRGGAGQGGERRGGRLEPKTEAGGYRGFDVHPIHQPTDSNGGGLETPSPSKRIHMVHSLVGAGHGGARLGGGRGVTGARGWGETTVGGLLPVPLASRVEMSTSSSDDGEE